MKFLLSNCINRDPEHELDYQGQGLGDGGTIGAPAAVINAVNDALSPFGVEIDEIPATPQRIRAAIRNAEKTA